MQTKKRHILSQIKKMYNKIQNLFQNEIEQIKWKINVLQDRLEQFKKKRVYFKMGLCKSQKCRIFHKMN